uniref:RNA-directed RNA polymerase n=1 Tax=Wenling minipizza batfish reovirus 1 TaxID=2116338 RepID=A0A2P1GN90_9REOV|nr:RNA-dependent RNA polymerase [Wenling minipizza batfish reovirus 1]
MDNLLPTLPNELAKLAQSVNGQTELDESTFRNAAAVWHKLPRSITYKWLSTIDFNTNIRVPQTIFKHKSWSHYFYIENDLIRRKKAPGIDDDVYPPNSDISPLLEPLFSTKQYGILRPELDSRATKGENEARCAVNFFKIATSQARQVKMDVTRFLQSLLILMSEKRVHNTTPSDSFNERPIHTMPSLHAIAQIMEYYKEGDEYYPPTLVVPSGVLWYIPPKGKTNEAHIPILLVDLVNLAIATVMCNIPQELEECAVMLYLRAAESDSYAHTILKTKSIFTAMSLHSMYRKPMTGGSVPVVSWLEPRNKYTFQLSGSKRLRPDNYIKAPTPHSKIKDLCAQYQLMELFSTLERFFSKYTSHTHESVNAVRASMACTSGMYLVRSPTESVMAEYTQNPDIQEPIQKADWTAKIGDVKYLKDTAPEPAKHLWDIWYKAAKQIVTSGNIDDPLYQAILRSQYVTSRGGSGQSLKDALADVDPGFKTYPKLDLKASKILQAAGTAHMSFDELSQAILASVSMGIRNQVQRRARTIMPLNIAQQYISAVHTIVADWINSRLNLSTTSGNAVQEKVIPLIIAASCTPNIVVNIDIKACDASITYDYFLSVIVGAIHAGFDSAQSGKSFMGVPSTSVRDYSRNETSVRSISGLQHMVQKLSTLYANGFKYLVKDQYAPKNDFSLITKTFPSGSTATSTEHTANNSTMMDYFLRVHLQREGVSDKLRQLASNMSISNNYVCQGDDGMCIIDGIAEKEIPNDVIEDFCNELKDYGKRFGWVYDIEANGTAEYLKLFALFGCRIPNVSRHPIVGKEYASADATEPWPGMIDIVKGLFENGLTDGFNWRKWLGYIWTLSCFVSEASLKYHDEITTAKYPMWSFIYFGIPPIRIFESDPWLFSPFTPSGDQGMYGIISLSKRRIRKMCRDRNYYTKKVHPVWGQYDAERLFTEQSVYAGYYVAQVNRNPSTRKIAIAPEDKQEFLRDLDKFIFQDPELKARVNKGKQMWQDISSSEGPYLRHVPSLEDLPEKWYENARSAEKATIADMIALYVDIEKVRRRPVTKFSKLLEVYLRVEWRAGERVPNIIDPHVPLVAGINMSNDDLFYKFCILGPMMISTKSYFKETLFVGRTLSGMDVDAIDAALLRLRARGAPVTALVAVLHMVGYSSAEANQIAAKVTLQDNKPVQIARMVNLAVDSKWMLLNFDYLINTVVQLKIHDRSDPSAIIPPRYKWLRSIYRLLGASLQMTSAGPLNYLYLNNVLGSSTLVGSMLNQWMSKGD